MSRNFTKLSISAAAVAILAGCGAPVGSISTGSSVAVAPIPAASPASEAGLQNWIQSFRPRALSQGISPATYDNAMRIARYNPDVIRLDRKQAEFSRPVWEYLTAPHPTAAPPRAARWRALTAVC